MRTKRRKKHMTGRPTRVRAGEIGCGRGVVRIGEEVE